jgi:hypothetical protein
MQSGSIPRCSTGPDERGRDVGRALAISAVALLLFGCTGGGEDDVLDIQATQEPATEQTEDPEPEATEEPEPEPEDPYAVPDEIDEAYVERVINAILEVRSEIIRGALQQSQGENLDPDLVALHFSTTEGRQRMNGLESFQRYIDDPESQSALLPADELGNSTFNAEELIHVEPERCIIVVGQWDRRQVSPEADSDEYVAFSLSRVDSSAEASEGNPTPWQWRGNTALVDTEDQPIDREYWHDLDYGAVLDHSCQDM